jgi:hypothetical protein
VRATQKLLGVLTISGGSARAGIGSGEANKHRSHLKYTKTAPKMCGFFIDLKIVENAFISAKLRNKIYLINIF